MGKIVWSPSSLNDIDLIAEYIARDSADRAALFVLRIIKEIDRLETFPESGRIILEIGNKHSREIIFSSYRIMYKIEQDDILITGIIHGSRKFDNEAE